MRVSLFVLALLVGMQSAAAEPLQPGSFVQRIGNQAVERLATDAPHEARAQRFAAMLEDHLALDAVTRFVTGPYGKRAGADERRRFRAAFKALLVSRFLPAFAGSRGIAITVREVEAIGAHAWAVRTAVGRDGDEPTAVTLRVIERDGRLKVADVATKGISMALMLRQEYTAFLERHDGDLRALTRTLLEKAGELDG